LILRKISKFDASRCQILLLKCTKFDFRWAPPQTPLRELTVPPDSLAVFKGHTSKGRQGKDGGKRRERGEGKRKGTRGEGKRRKGRASPTNIFGLEPPLTLCSKKETPNSWR